MTPLRPTYYQRSRQVVTEKVSGFWQLLGEISKGDNDSKNLAPRQKSKSSIARRHRPDYYLAMFMILLMLVGLVVMFSISPQIINATNNSSGADTDQYFYFSKQLVVVFLSLGIFLFTSRIPLDFWRKNLKRLLLVAGFFTLLLYFLSKVSPSSVCALGACRWLRLGSISLQVSEIVKFCLLLFFAFFWGYFAKKQLLNSKKSLLYSGVIMALGLLAIVVLQKDLGTGISMAVFLFAMLFVAGLKTRYLLIAGVLGVVAFVVAMITQPYRMARFSTFLKGDDADVTAQTHHINEARIALGSGGMFGLGVGKSIQSTGYLPEVINDSIFAIIGEVFGFVGAVTVILIFVGLLYRLAKGIFYSHDEVNRLLFAGAFGWVFAHLFINISSMTGIMPMTGITLPFLSYGGTSMLFISAVLGVVSQASAYTSHTPYFQENSKFNRGLRRG